jgi:hypothetical protein
MKISYDHDELPYCCGVTDVGGFDIRWPKADFRLDDLEDDLIESGTGMFTATFVNTSVCRQAYETLCKKYELIYQSPRAKNVRSGRDVFLCVFQGAKRG